MTTGSRASTRFRHRAIVTNLVANGTDGYGHVRTDGSETDDNSLACYAWASTEQAERFDEKAQGAIEVVRVVMGRDAPVTTRTVISSIVDKRGSSIFAGPLRVLGATRKADHLAVTCRLSTGGRA